MKGKNSVFRTFSTLGLPDAGWAEAVALARLHGFDGVELRALNGSIDLPGALRVAFGSPAAFARAVRESGLRVPSLDSSVRLCGAEEERRKELAELAVWADAAGIPYLRVFDGGETGSGNRPEIRGEIMRGWEAWRQLREREGFSCDLIVETHWALVRPADARRVGEESGGRLRLLWDIGHTWVHSGMTLMETWELLRPMIAQIHLKDLARDASWPSGWRDVLPGCGELPVPALLDELARAKFSGAVSLEWERFWHHDYPSLDEALQSGRRHGWWERTPVDDE